MAEQDLNDVVRVARTAFPDHYEALDCFAERFRLFPQGCFILASEREVFGYLIAYPWPLGSIPPLNSFLGKLPARGDAWYLHDLALHPIVRGQGLTRAVVERLSERAAALGARVLALVSVNGTHDYWQRLGFRDAPAAPDLAHKLESYGNGSIYMLREVAAVGP